MSNQNRHIESKRLDAIGNMSDLTAAAQRSRISAALIDARGSQITFDRNRRRGRHVQTPKVMERLCGIAPAPIIAYGFVAPTAALRAVYSLDEAYLTRLDSFPHQETSKTVNALSADAIAADWVGPGATLAMRYLRSFLVRR